MKTLIHSFGCLLIWLCHFTTFASGTPIAKAEVKSIELKSINGQLGFQLELHINEDLFITGEPTYDLPEGWSAFSYTHIKNIRCAKGQYFGIYVVLSHPTSNLPFYPQSITATIPVAAARDTSRKDLAPAYGKVYFTPYNTVEIWSNEAFYKLKRVWATEESVINTQRIYVPKASIPISDRPDTDTLEAWEDDFTLKRVEGLAYSIPMRAKHADSIALYNNDDLPPGVYADSLYDAPAQNAARMQASALKIGIHVGRKFQGVVVGRLMTRIINDLGQPQTIPLAGVNILLKEYDWYANETFGEVHTDENGYFYFSYEQWQSYGEGKTITLFLKYKSRNATYDIKVKEHVVLGGSQEAHTWLGDFGQNVFQNVGQVILDDDYFRPLHWAVKSFLFCQRNNAPLSPDLTILTHRPASYFLPDGTSGFSSPINRPTIYLMTDDCKHENTIYHEFGHFFMWNIQNKNYVIPVANDKSGDHSWGTENTSRLAWWEGWGDAFQMILDAAYKDEDKEYGFERGNSVTPIFERRVSYVTTSINNGLLSEYYIACAIYDLWDGANKGLPATIPGSGVHGYNDRVSGSWQTDDNVELSFFQLMLPLKLNGAPRTPIDNIYTYYSILLNQIIGNNCSLRADVARCFRENDVVLDINLDNYGVNAGMSSDGASMTINKVTIGQVLFTGNFYSYPNTYQINPTSSVNIPIKNNTYPFLTDYINIKKTPSAASPPVWSFNKGASDNNLISGTLSTCGGADIDVTDGKLVLGGSGFAATLQINEGSVVTNYFPSEITINPNSGFIIGNLGLVDIRGGGRLIMESGNIVVQSGGTLIIRSSSIAELRGTATIVVEPGGYLCIDQDANLNFSSLNQIKIVSGGIFGVNPALAITGGNCQTVFCPTGFSAGVEALRFDGIDDHVDVPSTADLNFNTAAFTMEAIIQSTRTNANGNIQVILSNRTSGDGDGFMFGLWSDGHLWAQLRGTPNIGYNQGPTILDGNCHHVAISRSNTNILSFYIDGVLTHQQLIPVRNISTAGVLHIGIDNPSGLPFEGLIGEVRLWNIERSANQIQSNTNLNLQQQPGLVALWDMNSSGQNLLDASGNNHNGVLGNTTTCDAADPLWIGGNVLACTINGNFRLAENDTESSSIIDVSAYPNPFNNEVALYLNALEHDIQVTITDGKGSVIFTKKQCDSKEVISFGDELPSGMYFVQATGTGGTKIIKLIKMN